MEGEFFRIPRNFDTNLTSSSAVLISEFRDLNETVEFLRRSRTPTLRAHERSNCEEDCFIDYPSVLEFRDLLSTFDTICHLIEDLDQASSRALLQRFLVSTREKVQNIHQRAYVVSNRHLPGSMFD